MWVGERETRTTYKEQEMRINGRAIAEKIYEDLRERVGELKEHGVTPTLAVMLVGDDPASKAYVGQKEKWGERIDIDVFVESYQPDVTTEKLLDDLHSLNEQRNVHGIIIQRPLPRHINRALLTNETLPTKDVDGFHPDSPFDPPVALAVEEMLKFIYSKKRHREGITFSDWIFSQHITILGKGETAGKPIQRLLTKRGLSPTVIDSKTPNPQLITKNADIIISAVGKSHVIKPEMLNRGAVLIGVGLHGEDSKLHGDYDEQEIKNTASFYTPTPGGVGPVNVAMLFANLLRAAENQSGVTNPRVISATRL